MRKMTQKSQLVYVLSLELNSNRESVLYRCNNKDSIQFIYGSSLFGRKVTLFTNYCDKCLEFGRDKYQELVFNDERTTITFKTSGSFHFYYTESNAKSKDEICGQFYIVVNPQLKVGPESGPEYLDLNTIQCQTVLVKSLGPFDTWKSKLEVAQRTGYNMIHFTPVQELGGSQSSYSLRNQLKLNPSMNSMDRDCSFEDLRQLIDWMRTEWKTHPECAYNCANSPWLRSAYLLDRVLHRLTLDIVDDRWKSKGLTSEVNTEEHLSLIRTVLREEYLPILNIPELYMVDTNAVLEVFTQKLKDFLQTSKPSKSGEPLPQLEVIQDPMFRRLKSTIDLNIALKIVCTEVDFYDNSQQWIEWSVANIRHKLSLLNDSVKNEVNTHLSAAIENVVKTARYERIDDWGPKHKSVAKDRPIVWQYFTHYGQDLDLLEDEKLAFDENTSQYLMAHNGWVMGDDPLRNFAEKGSNVYLRRELIAWGDSVKLRFGASPEDCPYLWTHMEKYVTQMATIFHGIRLDNCHSTPIHVAQYLLDSARRVNPDLYLIAELFTSHESLDNIFVNKLGINSLIREGLSAHDSHDLGRQVYRFGGEPIGAFPPERLSGAGAELLVLPLRPSVSHAIFFDVTHDNESPIVRRSAYDPLPSSALVAMTCCAIGSNRGFDELVPHHINVVTEDRQYRAWDPNQPFEGVSIDTGIIKSKREFNLLHQWLAANGYTHQYVDQRDADTVAVTRHNPITHESVVLVARTAFQKPMDPNSTGFLQPLRIDGKIDRILFETRMANRPDPSFAKHKTLINGYQKFRSQLKTDIAIEESEMVKVVKMKDTNEVHFTSFPFSSVIAFKVSLSDPHLTALKEINEIIDKFDVRESDINSIITNLSLVDLNFVLFRCHNEDMDDIRTGAYELSSLGRMNYCGIASIVYYLRHIRTNNDLGHPLCGNLRDGNWLMDYTIDRLQKKPQTLRLSEWLSNAFTSLSHLPRYLIPRYFDSVITRFYVLILEQIWSKSSQFVEKGSRLVQLLALGGVALVGTNKTALLPPLSPKVVDQSELLATMAAGLPHFSSGYMRCWGRDTFIALKGLLLLTGRFTEAKHIILGFAGTLRHGLIPNLLDCGKNPRYNARDAVWWWLQAIKDYCLLVQNGVQLLNEPVRRLFPTDDSPALLSADKIVEEPLHKTIQEAIQRHFDGIDFVERNAGKRIDEHMTEHGFHIRAGVSRETGFVYGGNEWNCGTWMDKMGSSEKAHNKGRPSTPRDGSAVELVGLSKSVVTFLSELNDKNEYPFDGVLEKGGQKFTFKEWSNKIRDNFEDYFHISGESKDDLINRRLIYKDTVGATIKWMDYQLRPNFLVAMVVAPELFDNSNAQKALKIVGQVLIGPLGVKTLDPSDLKYNGDYDNSNDSEDTHLAHGANYHNGPEWLWPLGYYLEALLKFSDSPKQTAVEIQKLLSNHFQFIESSDWFGLPELTNTEGKPCWGSCAIQAWSHSTILQVLHSIQFTDLIAIQ